MKLFYPLLFGSVLAVGASVGGNKAPDGMEIYTDLPGELHRKNTTSRGQGCCVWTSIHHASLYQNIPAYQEAPKWIQSKGIEGGAWPEQVARQLPIMARERGYSTPPPFINYEGFDLDILKLATKTGRMPGVTYSRSPTGRYGGSSISHMVNMPHCSDKWIAILDNNYIGADQYEWMTPAEYMRTCTDGGRFWATIFLGPPPPHAPRN